MSRDVRLVLAVVTSPLGVLLLHRIGHTPPVMFPGGAPEGGDGPGVTAERGCYEEARLKVRAGRVLGRHIPPGDRKPVVHVAARPLEDVTEDAVAMSLHVGWYSLEQVDLLIPDLWDPVRRHLEKTIPHR